MTGCVLSDGIVSVFLYECSSAVFASTCHNVIMGASK